MALWKLLVGSECIILCRLEVYHRLLSATSPDNSSAVEVSPLSSKQAHILLGRGSLSPPVRSLPLVCCGSRPGHLCILTRLSENRLHNSLFGQPCRQPLLPDPVKRVRTSPTPDDALSPGSRPKIEQGARRERRSVAGWGEEERERENSFAHVPWLRATCARQYQEGYRCTPPSDTCLRHLSTCALAWQRQKREQAD